MNIFIFRLSSLALSFSLFWYYPIVSLDYDRLRLRKWEREQKWDRENIRKPILNLPFVAEITFQEGRGQKASRKMLKLSRSYLTCSLVQSKSMLLPTTIPTFFVRHTTLLVASECTFWQLSSTTEERKGKGMSRRPRLLDVSTAFPGQ